MLDTNGVAEWRAGDSVFVPGAHCFTEARPLFGASARRLVVAAPRLVPNDAGDERGVLLALAATAHHALAAPGATPPDLVVGHGTLGQLLARIAVAAGHPTPRVWEKNPSRRDAAGEYPVLDPAEDERRDYRAIYDCSGDPGLLDTLVTRLARGGEIVLAGFYAAPLSFAFAPAFMREARLRIAAEWAPSDMQAVRSLLQAGRLSFDGLISHRASAREAASAYPRAFTDPSCRKMILDWSDQ